MKKLMFLTIVLLWANVCFGETPTPLDTVHQPFYLLRAEANETSDLIDLTSEGDFDSMPSGAVQLRANNDGTGHGGNQIEIIFCGGDAANDTFTYKIYAWRRVNSPARMAVTGTVTLGTQAVVKYPNAEGASNGGDTATSRFWGDTISITRYNFPTVPRSSDTDGNNEVASLTVDFSGYEWVYCEITNADGETGVEAGWVSVYYSYD